MVNVDASQWDETVCNMIACQHPPCWEAMRRIEKGHPRILFKNFKSLEQHFPETEDELPTLKIFNLPLNYSYKGRIKHPEYSIINIKDSRNYSTHSTVFEASFVPTISVLSSERNLFPGLNSRVESHTPHHTPISYTSLKQGDKIQMTGLSEFTAPKLAYRTAYGNLIVRWIPGTRHRCLPREKLPTRTCTPSQSICVKDLALEILHSVDSKKTFPKLQKREKSNKVPTGGQPYLLRLRRNPKSIPNKSSHLTSKERKHVESPAGKRRFVPQYLQLSPLGEVQRKDALHLDNKKLALRGPKGETSPLSVQKVPMKERDLGRIQSHLMLALEGDKVPKHLVSILPQQMNSATSTLQISEAHDQRREGGQHLPQEASAEKVPLRECSLQTSQVSINRRKPSLKYVEYKSNTVRLYMEGYDSSVHQISKSESKYKQYCKQIAIRKEAAFIQDDLLTKSGEPWLREPSLRSEENALQICSPPPPPPSPLVSDKCT